MTNQVQNSIFKANVFKKLQKQKILGVAIPKQFFTKENNIPNNLILKYLKFGQLKISLKN